MQTKIEELNNLTIKETATARGKLKRYKYSSGHTVLLSPHSVKRLSGRKGGMSKELFEDASVKVAHLFAEKVGIEGFSGIRSRVAVRSMQEKVIVILALDSLSRNEYTIAVSTVWNTDLGEFFFRRGMPIYDLNFSLEKGYKVQGAPINSYTLQEKYYWEK